MTAVMVHPGLIEKPGTPSKPLPAEYFEALYCETDDPWGFRSRWYETRKRALILACLNKPRYRRALEPACANGELAAALAPLCQELIASDFHSTALAVASQRLMEFQNTKVELRSLPDEFPAGEFDLIIFGEVGYYLDEASLRRTLRQAKNSLSDDGVFLACHWRHPIEGCHGDGDRVHRLIQSEFGVAPMVVHLEADFRIEMWSRDVRSVAECEGLR